MFTKTCSKCKQNKPISEFYLQRKNKDGLYPHCKSCYRLTRKKYSQLTEAQKSNLKQRVMKNYYSYHEKKLQGFKEYRQKNKKSLREGKRIRDHRRRVLELNCEGDFTQQEWNDLLDRYENKCLCCGKKAEDTREGKLTQDHVIPLSLGGTNYISNIQPLCFSCNAKKHTKMTDYRSI